jgi:WD40 repeat protein
MRKMRRVGESRLAIALALLLISTLACKAFTSTASPDESPVTVESPATGAMPDLVAGGRVTMPGANGCVEEYLPLVSEICVENQGDGPAGAFILQAGEDETWQVDGLDAGENICFDSKYSTGMVSADVDNDIAEEDETNNDWQIPAPTPPAICTPESQPASPSTLPENLQVIAPENAANITEIASWQANGPLMDLAWAPGGQTLAVAHASSVSIYNRQTLELVSEIETGYQLTALAFSPDGGTLATGSYDGKLTLWDAGSGAEILTLSDNVAAMSLSFSPDGAELLSGGWYTGEAEGEGVVILWDVSSRQQVRKLGEYTKGIGSAAISPAGDLIAWGGEFYDTVSLWDRNADTDLEPLNVGPGVYGLAFSPVEGILAAGSSDGSVKEWDILSATLLQTFQVHQDLTYIRRIAFFPLDGSILAAGSESGVVKLWYTSDNFELASLDGHSGEIWGLAFSPDGKLLATASLDGEVRLWGVVP